MDQRSGNSSKKIILKDEKFGLTNVQNKDDLLDSDDDSLFGNIEIASKVNVKSTSARYIYQGHQSFSILIFFSPVFGDVAFTAYSLS